MALASDAAAVKAEHKEGPTALAVVLAAPPAALAMDLPLLSDKQDRIVDFAKIYQRSNDEDVYESLLDLSEELAGIASIKAEQRERRALEGQQEKITYATDQLTLLTTSSEHGGGIAGDTANNKTALAKQQLLSASRARETKGKPMRRYQGSTVSPFEHALVHSAAAQARHDEERDDDALYVKVQQIAWEDDIIWGIDFGVKSKQNGDETAAIEENEDEEGLVGGGMSSKPNGYGTPFARSSSSDAANRDSLSRSDRSTKSSASTGYKTLSYKEMYPRRKMATADMPWVPSYTEEEFDMTKPRNYRWEIRTSENGGAKSNTSYTTPIEQKKKDPATAAKLPCPLNKELADGSWVAAIGWNSTQDMPESKLILDDNDASLILTVPDMDDVRPTLRIPERKLGAAEIKLEQLDKQRREKKQRIDAVMGNLEFGDETAEGRLGTEGGGKKNKDSRVVKNIGYVHHSLPAIKLSMTKPELPKTKLREFHRPRSKFKINERMAFTQPPVVPIPPVEEGGVVTQIKKSSDLNLTTGGKIILVEYTEQNPPMLSNPGMASRILHYWRPPDNEEDTLVGKKKVKKAKPKAPEMKMGQVITLGHHDETPFVGDVPPGRVVTSLNSKLYKVPIFQHKPVAPFAPSTSSRESGQYELFLLCRSVSKSKKGAAIGESAKTTLYIFEMPDLFLAGQIEPQIEVPAPNSRSANDFIRPYMSFHILRLFKKASDGERLKIEDIARAFPNQSGTAIRKRMKEVATFERGGNDSGWWKKKPASQLTSEEEIRASINPESVCLYESMMAGHRRLLDIGLTKLFTPTGVQGAINLLLKRLELRKQALTLALVEPLKLERRAKEKAEQDVWKRDATVRKLETDIQVARYIHEQLQLTPWNLTNNYVECHLQGKGSGMLLLGGIGDPTGRGEGFSFVRVPQSRAKKKEGEEETTAGPNADAAAVQKAVAAVTGTTADLRKLKMKEAGDVLRNLGVAEADIKKLRRWDRIHMVRELSSLATAHGRAGALSKFARGARKSLSAQQQDYRRKCDVIYERQMNVLSATTVQFSDDEESGDDSDILELEDELLGAGSFGKDDREKIVKLGPKNLFTKGGGGLNRSKEALAEREDAVELERLMKEMKEDSGATSASRRSDVDASKLRTQLRASGITDGGSGSANSSVVGGQGGTRPGSSMGMSHGGSNMASAINTPIEHRSRASSPTSASKWPSSGETPSRVPGRKVLKRTTRVVEEDGTETVRIEFIVDDKQVARFQAKQHRQDRLQKADERSLLKKRKRMLALEDDTAGSSLLDVAKRRKQLQEELKQLQRTEEQNKDYVEMLEREGEAGLGPGGTPQKGGGVRCTQCGQLGHMRTNRSCPLYMADGGGGVTGEASGAAKKIRKAGSDEVEKITVNLAELREGARKHEAEKKRKRIQEQKEQAEMYKKPYMNTVVKQSRSRMPVSHLNGNLSVVIEKLMDMPESELFRSPVDASAVKDYYQIIKQPMDLSTIKKKIDDMEYDSMRDFIKDLELIVNNSKIYNGDPTRSLITANAVKIQKRAQEELSTLNAEGGTPTAVERS